MLGGYGCLYHREDSETDLIMGNTSEPHEGQWNVLSGRRRISGWPHSSQACSPRASGRATICSSVPTIAPSKAQPHEPHPARPDPRGSSSSELHAGQTRWPILDVVVRDRTFARFISLPPFASCGAEREALTCPDSYTLTMSARKGKHIPQMSYLFVVQMD